MRAMCPDCGTTFEFDGEFNQDNLLCSEHVTTKEIASVGDLQTCDESVYWNFISERHHIYLRREAGMPKPWTQDPILQQYKFVNVFRRLDRTSRWLYEKLLAPHVDDAPALLAFNICWYRMFCRIETGEMLGWQTNWNRETWWMALNSIDGPVFTGAYIIHSEVGKSKIESINEVCGMLYDLIMGLGIWAKDAGWPRPSMQYTWKRLQQIPHIGQFMAYQMVLDMMEYDQLLGKAVDRATWTCTGPGALRGLKRLDPRTTPRDSLQRMRDLQTRSAAKLAEIGATHVPPMDIHDIEFCLCELDKYVRVQSGEGRPRSSYPGLA